MNEKEIKKITSLSQGKFRHKYGLFLVEGPHLVHELLRSDWHIKNIIISRKESYSKNIKDILEMAAAKRVAVQTVEERPFEKLSTTQTPQGVLAVAPIPQMALERILSEERIIVLDGISDPGNLGSIIRTAAAFGFRGLVTTAGSADIYSPKVVRATQGAIFRLAFAEHLIPAEVIENLKIGHKIYALSPHKGAEINAIETSGKMALVVGAEISGVDPLFLKAAHQLIRIPMTGQVESLNAAVAAGIAMYKFSLGRKR